MKPVVVFSLLLAGSLAFGNGWKACLNSAIPMDRAVRIAKEYVGKPYKAWLSRKKRTRECLWKVRGNRGFVIINAEDGEVIKFSRYR